MNYKLIDHYLIHKKYYTIIKNIRCGMIGGDEKLINRYNNYKQWLPDLWGNIKIIKYNDRDEVVNKPDVDKNIVDNCQVKFSFIPELWTWSCSDASPNVDTKEDVEESSEDVNNDVPKTNDSYPIEYNKNNYKAFNNYINSSEWSEFLKYTFFDMSVIATSNNCKVKISINNIVTQIKQFNGIIMIVIKGIATQNTQNTNNSIKKISNKHCDVKYSEFYDYVTDAFIKAQQKEKCV